MTVSTINSVAEFVTNGATKNFPFYFKFLDSRDLVVTYIDPNGTSTVLTMGTQYTVSGAGNDKGGGIYTTTALLGPGKLIVSRDMEAYQQTSLRNQGKFLADLAGLARHRLQAMGVEVHGNDSSAAWCTFSQPQRFYSYRRASRTGRMAAAVWLSV